MRELFGYSKVDNQSRFVNRVQILTSKHEEKFYATSREIMHELKKAIIGGNITTNVVRQERVNTHHLPRLISSCLQGEERRKSSNLFSIVDYTLEDNSPNERNQVNSFDLFEVTLIHACRTYFAFLIYTL